MIRVLAATVAAMCGVAHACGNPGDKLANGAHYTIAFKTAPAPIKTSEHFAIDLTVCPLGKAPMPRTVRVDASMPEHRHGMNYKPTIVAKGPGRYRAEGMLFHMSGRWEIAFEVVTGGTTERIATAIELQ
jgi:YtkA-like protein